MADVTDEQIRALQKQQSSSRPVVPVSAPAEKKAIIDNAVDDQSALDGVISNYLRNAAERNALVADRFKIINTKEPMTPGEISKVQELLTDTEGGYSGLPRDAELPSFINADTEEKGNHDKTAELQLAHSKDFGYELRQLKNLYSARKNLATAEIESQEVLWGKQKEFEKEQEGIKRQIRRDERYHEQDKAVLLKSREEAFKKANTNISNFNAEITKIANENPSAQVFGNIFSILAVAVGGYRAGLTGGSNEALSHLNRVVDQLARRNLGRINAIKGKISSEDRLLRNTLMQYDTDDEKLALLRSGIVSAAEARLDDANRRYKLGLGDQQLADLKKNVFLKLKVDEAQAMAGLDTNYLKLQEAIGRRQDAEWHKRNKPLSPNNEIAMAKMDDPRNARFKPFREQISKLNASMAATTDMVRIIEEAYNLDAGIVERFLGMEHGNTQWVQAFKVIQDAMSDDEGKNGAAARLEVLSKLGGMHDARAFALANPEQGKKITQKDFTITKGRLAKIFTDQGMVRTLEELKNKMVRDRALFTRLVKNSAGSKIWTHHPGMRGSAHIQRYSGDARILMENVIHPSAYGTGQKRQKANAEFLQSVLDPYINKGLLPQPIIFDSLAQQVNKDFKIEKKNTKQLGITKKGHLSLQPLSTGIEAD